MDGDFLSRNLQRFPRLTELFTTEVAKNSRFLTSIAIDMRRKPLSELQGFKASQAIVERSAREVQQK